MSTSATSAPPGGRCGTAEVDLEALAGGYRHRPVSDTALRHAAAAVKELAPGAWVLDVGSGRGDHAAVWARLGYKAVALDPGRSMAEAAVRHDSVSVVRGRSQALPFRDRSLALVYFHLSIHYGDWRKALDEAVRVLATGGACAVWTLGAAHHRTSMLARWFPSIGDIDSKRFPDPALVAARMEESGLEVDRGRQVEDVHRAAGEWAAAVRAGFVSTLQLVPPVELDAGLAAFEKAHPDPREMIRYELRWDWIRGVRVRD